MTKEILGQASAAQMQEAPEMQLRFLFDEYDIKRQALAEKKKLLQEQIRSAPGYAKAAQRRSDAGAELKKIKDEVAAANSKLNNEIDVLQGAVSEFTRQMEDKAGAVYRKRGAVEFEDGMGRKVVGCARFKFVRTNERREERVDRE